MKTKGAGKGGVYRPVNKQRYDKGYDRAFGVECTVCKGKGYLWDYSDAGPYKSPCHNCNGRGRTNAQT